tara:strand:+ start:330 stop:569 length:240 start_codon:yes stop_codon:yes gene_type:complete
MKTIYDRLQPDILDSIKVDLKKYPYSTKALVNTLKTATSWSDLKVQDVNSIINHSHFNLFSISHMDLLWGDKFLTNEEK